MARQIKLSPERKEFIQQLLGAYKPEDVNDVQDMLKDLLGDTLQAMLEPVWMAPVRFWGFGLAAMKVPSTGSVS